MAGGDTLPGANHRTGRRATPVSERDVQSFRQMTQPDRIVDRLSLFVRQVDAAGEVTMSAQEHNRMIVSARRGIHARLRWLRLSLSGVRLLSKDGVDEFNVGVAYDVAEDDLTEALNLGFPDGL